MPAVKRTSLGRRWDERTSLRFQIGMEIPQKAKKKQKKTKKKQTN